VRTVSPTGPRTGTGGPSTDATGARNDLGPDLPAVAAGLRDLVFVSNDGVLAEYATTLDRDGGTFVHFVYFMRDHDGVWKIVAM
jgi:hypothetical protein